MRFTSIIAAVATLTTAVLGQTSEQQAALDMHNAARAELGLNPLIWDQQLAAGAQDWANHLVSVGSLEHSQTQGQGENLASQSDPQDAWRGAVRQWMDEKPKYHGEAISETNYQIFGHYTQAIWGETTNVGMGLASDGSGNTYVVARYSTPGNYIGQTPY